MRRPWLYVLCAFSSSSFFSPLIQPLSPCFVDGHVEWFEKKSFIFVKPTISLPSFHACLCAFVYLCVFFPPNKWISPTKKHTYLMDGRAIVCIMLLMFDFNIFSVSMIWFQNVFSLLYKSKSVRKYNNEPSFWVLMKFHLRIYTKPSFNVDCLYIILLCLAHHFFFLSINWIWLGFIIKAKSMQR